MLEKRVRRWVRRWKRPISLIELDNEMITKRVELFDIEPHTIDLTDPPLFTVRPMPFSVEDRPPLFGVDPSAAPNVVFEPQALEVGTDDTPPD